MKFDTVSVVLLAGLAAACLAIAVLLYRERRSARRSQEALARKSRVNKDLLESSMAVREALARREEVEERERFLATATTELTSTLDYELMLARVDTVMIPAFADWCSIEFVAQPQDSSAVPSEQLRVRSLSPGTIEQETIDEFWPGLDITAVTSSGVTRVHPRLAAAAGEGSAVVVRLAARGQTLGALVFGRCTNDRRFRPDDAAFAEALGRRVSVALDNVLLHRAAELALAEAEAAVARMRRLQTVIEAAFSSGSLDEILSQLLERLCEAIRADSAAILIVDERGSSLVVRKAVGLMGPPGLRVPMGAGFAGGIAATQTHRVVNDLDRDESFAAPSIPSGLVSVAGVPLVADGSLLGVLQVGSKRRREFDEEDVMLLRLVAARASISIDRGRMFEREQSVAESLQRSLLPSRLPTIPGFEFAARYVPGTQGLDIGGDWYDVFELADGSVGLTVGDVMGRGLRAAATMGHLRHVMRAYALEGLMPGETLQRLNRIAAETEIFATVVYAVVSPSRNTMRIASAGHLPPIRRSAGGSVGEVREGLSLPLGVGPNTSFAEVEVELEPGCSLVFYTDGLVERRGESIDDGIARLTALVAGSDPPAHKLVDAIIEGLEIDGDPDDRAVLAVKMPRTAAPRMTVTFAPHPGALAEARRDLRLWLADHGAHADEIFDIVVAVNEACSNAIEHPVDASDNQIGLEAEISDGRLAIVVNDAGRWRSARASRNRGRGLMFMNELMESLEIGRSSDGTSVRLERVITGRPSWSETELT
ncbi:MAG TPA: SpoIIE family protein phosphatase [Gaiellaceae bacterium]|jgi:serine phosphatase RsbU (regulator of sigma subunit)/anti-sigma regulatory factor (Ser/Thr protein kinase)|nr:SpoIIE family protein phosphatase [Gaiellaceae bacterium]